MQILLVEDNLGDIELTKEALDTRELASELHVVRDGAAALDFLRRLGPYGDAPRPDLVLLDLNLPRLTGQEVLEEVKRDEALMAIPIVVLTSSAEAEDVTSSYSLHANCYVQKPVGLDEFIDTVHRIEDFWFVTAKLPPRAH